MPKVLHLLPLFGGAYFLAHLRPAKAFLVICGAEATYYQTKTIFG